MANRRRHNPNESLGYLIGVILVVAFVVSFWQVIIACIIGAFLLYLLWYFRNSICQGIAAVSRSVFRLVSRGYNRIADAWFHRQTHHHDIPENEDIVSDDDLPMIKRR